MKFIIGNWKMNGTQNEKESLSRYAIIGDIFYIEKQYDSAWVYLNKVFHETSTIGSKKQAAEWLVEICKEQGTRIFDEANP